MLFLTRCCARETWFNKVAANVSLQLIAVLPLHPLVSNTGELHINMQRGVSVVAKFNVKFHSFLTAESSLLMFSSQQLA